LQWVNLIVQNKHLDVLMFLAKAMPNFHRLHNTQFVKLITNSLPILAFRIQITLSLNHVFHPYASTLNYKIFMINGVFAN